MVTVRGGGETYQIASGKQMEWGEVPPWFKEAMTMQQEEPKCVEIKRRAQQCMNERGFWDEDCTKLTEEFHLCAANELRRQLPATATEQAAMQKATAAAAAAPPASS
jgi:hypothetical protein